MKRTYSHYNLHSHAFCQLTILTMIG